MHKQKKIILVIVCLVAISVISTIFLKNVSSYFEVKRLNAQAEQFSNSIEISTDEIAKNFKGNFSFVFKDLKNQLIEVRRRGNYQYAAASLIKVPMLVSAFYAVEEGLVNLDQEVVINKKDITGGSGVLKACKLPKKITFSELLEFMISRSDNTASNKLIDILGFEYINSSFKRMGLEKTALNRKLMDFSLRKKGIENYISCNDLVTILEKIYRKEMVDSFYSEIMLSFLLKQRIKDRIPKYLPKYIPIAHKTGLVKNSLGDAGIVFCRYSDYIICVITSGFSDYASAKEFVAKISEAVYNTYTRL